MNSDQECAAAVLAVASVIKKKNKRQKKEKTKNWVKSWLTRLNEFDLYTNIFLMELCVEDGGECKKLLRMTLQIFDDLLNLIQCDIKKKKFHHARTYTTQY